MSMNLQLRCYIYGLKENQRVNQAWKAYGIEILT